ncbi:MAG: prepilin peptidase [Novosphingobium sp.]
MNFGAAGAELWHAAPALRVVLGGVLGALFGSFIGAAAVRLPAGVSPIAGRSRCDGCGRPLGPGELVPLLSFALQRGRCRGCARPIDRWQPAAEAGGLLIGALAAGWSSGPITWAVGFILGLQLLLLGLLDLRHFWLPERLVVLLAATGLAWGWLRFGATWDLLAECLAGGAIGFGLLWLPAAGYRKLRGREGMGAGDPKLLGAMGLWLGPLSVVLTLLGASLAGLIAAAGLALGGRRIDEQTVLPLGSLLALAGWIVWLANGGLG